MGEGKSGKASVRAAIGLALSVALGLSSAVVAPAWAGTLTVPDPTGDVWESHYDDDGQLQGWSWPARR